MTECIFCRIAAGDMGTEFVYEDEQVVGFRDLNPQAPVHILLIPRRHIATPNDLGPEDEALVGRLVTAAARVAAREGLSDRGYRTLINCNAEGGQTVFHLHLHLLGGRQMGWPPG